MMDPVEPAMLATRQLLPGLSPAAAVVTSPARRSPPGARPHSTPRTVGPGVPERVAVTAPIRKRDHDIPDVTENIGSGLMYYFTL